MNREHKHDLFTTIAITAVAALLLWFACSCTSFKRTAMVGGGAGAGAAIGSLAGPGGTIGGAIVGGAVSSAVVDSDILQDRTEKLEDRLYGGPPPPRLPVPPWYTQIPWWTWLIVLWLYLRRAHLWDALTGKEPRLDAIMRALGLRTHHTPIPSKP